jgi:hypothetical protein
MISLRNKTDAQQNEFRIQITLEQGKTVLGKWDSTLKRVLHEILKQIFFFTIIFSLILTE